MSEDALMSALRTEVEGRTVAEANEAVKPRGMRVVPVIVDGEYMVITADLDMSRIRVETRQHKVVKVVGRG